MVFFHGGGWTSGSWQQFDGNGPALAERGMVVFSADYRIKDQHGTSPFEAVHDAKSAIRFVRGHASDLGLDPGRIVGAGSSALGLYIG